MLDMGGCKLLSICLLYKFFFLFNECVIVSVSKYNENTGEPTFRITLHIQIIMKNLETCVEFLCIKTGTNKLFFIKIPKPFDNEFSLCNNLPFFSVTHIKYRTHSTKFSTKLS